MSHGEAHYTEPMTRHKVMELLKDELTLDSSESYGYYGEHSLQIELKLGKATLGTVSVDLSSKCKCKCRDTYY